MIKVNNREHEWWNGMTVEELLEKLNYTYPVLIVTVQGVHIGREDYGKAVINDGDDVKIIHPVCGG